MMKQRYWVFSPCVAAAASWRPFLGYLFLLSAVSPVVSGFPNALAQDCASQVKDIPIKSIVASAGFFANMRGSVGSISYESNAIFEEARTKAPTVPVPENLCVKGCTLKNRGTMFFRSAPSKVLTDYEDSDHCNTLQKATSQKPLHYENDNIQSVEDLEDWIGDLSQGKGDLGGDLYEKCDKSCSPRFEYVIAKNESSAGYNVHASVICGPARDKDDNNYDLSSFFRWACE